MSGEQAESLRSVERVLRIDGLDYGRVNISVKTRVNGGPPKSTIGYDYTSAKASEKILKTADTLLSGKLTITCQSLSFKGTCACVEVLVGVLERFPKDKRFGLDLRQFSKIHLADYYALTSAINGSGCKFTVKFKVPGIPSGKKPSEDSRIVIGPKFTHLEVKKLEVRFKFESWFKVNPQVRYRVLKLDYIRREKTTEYVTEDGKEIKVRKRFARPYKRDMAHVLRPFVPTPANASMIESFSLSNTHLEIKEHDESTWRNSGWLLPRCKHLVTKEVSFEASGGINGTLCDIGTKRIVMEAADSAFLRLFRFPNLVTLKLERYKETDSDVMLRLMSKVKTLSIQHSLWFTIGPIFANVLPKIKVEILSFSGVDLDDEGDAIPLHNSRIKPLKKLVAKFNSEQPTGGVFEDTPKRDQNRNVTGAEKRPNFERRCDAFVKRLLDYHQGLTFFDFEAGHVYKQRCPSEESVGELRARLESVPESHDS